MLQLNGLTKWETSLVALNQLDNLVDLTLDSGKVLVDFDVSQPAKNPTIYSECQDLSDMKMWLLSLERAGLRNWEGYENAQDTMIRFLGADLDNQLNSLLLL